ncbi:Protein of uncharacterised function (DUF1622) [Providencia rustigianii]|uniref:DUF1622 domain-containing protein n=2 Tax=Providencia rustigianii TaxID=158850 RepID=D1P322_9GAMM|nr:MULTISPECIES: DUF1622 domain-containing protein [Providencia]EFB72211.1 hypothetical protein PROVRUST_06611 [Providencia rustigianii DSM 4541]MTC57921.1 DUF1622 domain-containing protein [Providencia rustigianii]MTC59325.1 DUF1622 domain-containing protein [Providencia rustigianii]SPY78047.1 Protein of uncharacterised function (DUF1622) [Providencia rustigianii]SUC27598.1 Protein of uncharacterised function (DUF1622) [Providencia rustigianii]
MFDLNFLRELLVGCVHFLQLLLETISVICVVIGLGKTLVVLCQLKGERVARYCFGNWLAMALEFQLAADILATTIDPDLDSLIKLGIIAVIRTFLNYFLAKELEQRPK